MMSGSDATDESATHSINAHNHIPLAMSVYLQYKVPIPTNVFQADNYARLLGGGIK